MNISTGHRTISELCPTKADVKLEKFFISYRRLKIQKYSVSVGVSCFGFSFYERFNRQFIYPIFLYSKP